MADSSLKWIALVALVVQNSGLALAMRYTMVYPSADGRYYASTAVVAAEMLKFAIAFVLFYVSDCKGKFSEFKRISKIELVDNRMDWLKLTVPSILYTLQNSLQYFSMTQLSAPVFQVLYQMKIVTTAIFSVSILARRITSLQWLSIVALSGGVALVQLSQTQHSSTHSNSFIGFVSVICGCFTSGFAGVYFEMVLKSSKASIWLRNIQLAVIGMVTGGIACYMRDGDLIANNGFLFGYNNAVYFVVFLQAAGGLIVAVVVKYADNVLKGFATSLSIILSCLVSYSIFHDIDVSVAFMTGAGIVLLAAYMFGYQPKPVSVTANSGVKGESGESTHRKV